jgi:RNA polymerase sigma-70 factor, ECF subfamily
MHEFREVTDDSEESSARREEIDETCAKKLMIRVKCGDSEAFATLVKLHSGLVFSVCLDRLHNKTLVEDAVQDVWMKVWTKRHTFDTSKSFKAWLWRIAYNTSIDAFRRESLKHKFGMNTRVGLGPENDAFGELIHLGIPVDRVLDARRSLENICTALPQMKADDQTLFDLRFSQGLPNNVIADLLGVPQGTIGRRILFLKRRLLAATERCAANFGKFTTEEQKPKKLSHKVCRSIILESPEIFTESQLEILSMFYLDGMNARKISETAGINCGAVRSCLRRGREKIRAAAKK